MKPRPTEKKTQRLESDSHNATYHQIESGQMSFDDAKTMVRLYPDLASALEGRMEFKSVKVKTRTIFIKSETQTQVGFKSFEEADACADKIIPKNCRGERDDLDVKVRVRFRQRTQLWDVVVKVAREVPIENG